MIDEGKPTIGALVNIIECIEDLGETQPDSRDDRNDR
jgi:hypothetical protein